MTGVRGRLEGFDPPIVAGLLDEDVEAMLADRGPIRFMAQLRAAPHNAAVLLQIAAKSSFRVTVYFVRRRTIGAHVG